MTEATITFTPRPLQKYLLDHMKRFSVLVMHRRFGKTYLCVAILLLRALSFNGKCPLTGRPLDMPKYLYLAPHRSQAKGLVWDEFKKFLKNVPGVHYNNSELTITLPNGAKIFVDGTEIPDKHRGHYFDGVVLDEYGQMPDNLFGEVIRPTLSDRLGWAIFIGTVKGRNRFWELYEDAIKDDNDWFGALFHAEQTGHITEEELTQIKHDHPLWFYRQEYMCDPDAIVQGAYFSEPLEFLREKRRIKPDFDYDNLKPVHTAWDIGLDGTAIWFFQMEDDHYKFIDYIHEEQIPLPDIARKVLNKPYAYGTHLVPHDAEARYGNTGETRIDVLKKMGFNIKGIRSVQKKARKYESINAAYSMLYKCKFNSETCKLGLQHLASYRPKYNKQLGAFTDEPEHGVESHGADAFQCFATGYKRLNINNRPKSKNQIATDDYDYLSGTKGRTL